MALGRKKARMESLELLRPTKITRNIAVTIAIGVIVTVVIAGIGLPTILTTTLGHPNPVSSKQCGHPAPTKMFDEESVPKYIIGPGYKVIPVNPTTTEVILCT